MAHSFTISYNESPTGQVILISELEAETASEVGPINVPSRAFMRGIKATLVSGTGTTILPSGGKVAGFVEDTNDQVFRGPNGGVASSHINDQSGVSWFTKNGELYLRSNVDAGVDNTIVTELHIAPHWEA